jgi:hypothetical protein
MKNKSIKIVIPSDLTPEQEAIEISKKLTGKLLSGSANQKDKLRLGNEVNISYLNTHIEIERKVHNLIEFVPCPYCKVEYQNDLFFRVWTNYGGKTKQHRLCSDGCQESYIGLLGEGRSSKTKNGLEPVRFY